MECGEKRKQDAPLSASVPMQRHLTMGDMLLNFLCYYNSLKLCVSAALVNIKVYFKNTILKLKYYRHLVVYAGYSPELKVLTSEDDHKPFD
jgi:hypothetical protein